jgi:hypothetical protein
MMVPHSKQVVVIPAAVILFFILLAFHKYSLPLKSA